jgi:serine/threonine protein kinase
MRRRFRSPADPAVEPERYRPEHARWELDEGAEIAPGRTVVRRLGGGSRYEVYLVWDDRLFALTVAKVLRPDLVEDDRALAELAREAAVLERLAHPVLVRGFDAVLDAPFPHLLLEHLEGPTLRRLIKREQRLPLAQILPLALHVAAALHYLAAEGVVHLDVKPANIVMGVPPRLIDLSIARSFEEAARLRAPIGTDEYMAPEQCDPGTGQIGPAADVWGLGATLHHAVAGDPPFGRADRNAPRDQRFRQLSADPPPPADGTPPPLADLVLAMLARDPSARPAAGDVALALEPLVAELPRDGSRRRSARL